MIRHYFQQLKNNERGATAVEFAIVAFLLIILIFGIIEFGWIFFGWITLTGAVREGARLAIVGVRFESNEDDDEISIKGTVENHARVFNNLEVDMPQRGAHGTSTSVSAKGDLPLALGFFLSGSSITLSAEATMRQE